MKKLLKRLWNSSTFTTWGTQFLQPLRLLLLTPLVLTRFEEVEIAAWYLFASLNFFGHIISQRLGVTFTRMFAFAMAGASDLGPLKSGEEREKTTGPNWESFRKAYQTIGLFNLVVGVLSVGVATVLGIIGLGSITKGYDASSDIWIAFGVMQLSSVIAFGFQKYAMALRGMNYVSLANRWDILFSQVSLFAGVLTLFCGGGLVWTVVVMQFIYVAGCFRHKILLAYVEKGKVRSFKGIVFHREVLRWCWEPLWKGTVENFAGLGVMQVAAIVVAARFDIKTVLSYLFTMRMIHTLMNFSIAPLHAVTPRLAKQLAAGKVDIWPEVVMRSRLVIVITIVGMLVMFLCGDYVLGLIGANARFLGSADLLLLFGFYSLERYHTLCIHIGLLSNQVIAFERRLAGGFLAVVMCFLFSGHSLTAMYSAMFISFQVAFATATTVQGAKVIGVGLPEFARKATIPYVLTGAVFLISGVWKMVSMSHP